MDWGTIEFYPASGDKLDSGVTFKAKLQASEEATGSLLCLGLDPEPDLLPASIDRSPSEIARFIATIVEAVGDSVSSYKLNLAFYERWGRETGWLLDRALQSLPKDRPVILDAKRGDVGSTAQAYAHAIFEAWGADAVTVHPYLGYDSVAPFLAHKEKEVFIVCRTSNPGASEFQHLRVEGEALYRHIARAGVRWDHHDNVGFVVGATAPAELRDVRQIAGDRQMLVPGIGAQGGDLPAAVRAVLRPDGRGAVISVSRGILFASSGSDYADAASASARRLRDAINALRPQPATTPA
jgi:orotidine-5'-phosphate decarboxylase